jgi:hypothetical protein
MLHALAAYTRYKYHIYAISFHSEQFNFHSKTKSKSHLRRAYVWRCKQTLHISKLRKIQISFLHQLKVIVARMILKFARYWTIKCRVCMLLLTMPSLVKTLFVYVRYCSFIGDIYSKKKLIYNFAYSHSVSE